MLKEKRDTIVQMLNELGVAFDRDKETKRLLRTSPLWAASVPSLRVAGYEM